MSIETFPFGPIDATSDQYSRLFFGVSSPGTESGLTVTAVSGQMKVQVAAGKAVINGFTFTSDAAEQLDIADNTTGIDRIDLVVLSLNVLFEDLALDVITGYSDTDIPEWYSEPQGITQIPLAYVVVPDGATEITNGMITDYRQHLSMGLGIVDSEDDLDNVDSRAALDVHTALLHVKPSNTWQQWDQTIDGSQIVTGKLSPDRLPFAALESQVVIPDGADNQSPTFHRAANRWGYSYVNRTDYWMNYSISDGTQFGSTEATKKLMWDSSTLAFSATMPPTDPELIAKLNSGFFFEGFIDLQVQLPKIVLSGGQYTGTQAYFLVTIWNPFTGKIYNAFYFQTPFISYSNTAGVFDIVNIRRPIFFNATEYGVQVKVEGWKMPSSGSGGYIIDGKILMTYAQRPWSL
jgi:hypothetical protein